MVLSVVLDIIVDMSRDERVNAEGLIECVRIHTHMLSRSFSSYYLIHTITTTTLNAPQI
jgi:hypothetical protein